jgi:hypothetical protein
MCPSPSPQESKAQSERDEKLIFDLKVFTNSHRLSPNGNHASADENNSQAMHIAAALVRTDAALFLLGPFYIAF